MSQMISGLEALYSRNILYRDLKLDNILFYFNNLTKFFVIILIFYLRKNPKQGNKNITLVS